MKILIHCNQPFLLAHGGLQNQIQQTWHALERVGLEVEPLRWWDDMQSGRIIHYFGRMPSIQIKLARLKGVKVVMADLLTGAGSRSQLQLWFQRVVNRALEHLAPQQFISAFNWESFRLADACIALTPWEAQLMTYLFGAPQERIHVVPNGVEDEFFQSTPIQRGPWLVCTATITERKRVLELAEAAVEANTPVWIIGKSYAESDFYAQRFYDFARQHQKTIRFEGPIHDRAKLAQVYREARGFVLLSTMESLSLSALEAAACECPLLLSDLPWARGTFGENARYCPIEPLRSIAGHLRMFYDQAPSLKPLPKPPTWTDVACQLKAVYERVLSTSW